MEGKVREYDGNGGQRMLFYDGGVKKNWEQQMVPR